MPTRLDHRIGTPLDELIGPCDPCVADTQDRLRDAGQPVPVTLIDAEERRYATCACWGWRRADGGLRTCAPVEEISSHPLWHDANSLRRTAVPVRGWTDADGWSFAGDGRPLLLAALWRRDDDGLAVAVIDQPALPAYDAPGRRMPIAMPLDLAFDWMTGLPMSRARLRQWTELATAAP